MKNQPGGGRGGPSLTITAFKTWEEARGNFEGAGVRVVLGEANARVLRKLVRARIIKRDGQPPRYFRDLGPALQDCKI